MLLAMPAAMSGPDGALRSSPDVWLTLLQSLLEISQIDRDAALTQAADIVASAFRADKVDVFLLEEATQTLVAVGTSRTPLGIKQKALGLDRLPLANGGRTVEVFQSGEPFFTGQADHDGDLPGIVDQGALAIRSQILVQLQVAEERRGVLLTSSLKSDHFSPQQVQFLQAASSWLGLIVARTELTAAVALRDAAEARRQTAERLIAVLAHDVRNLLTPVRLRSMRIQRRAEQEVGSPYLSDARGLVRSVDRMERLMESLLNSERLAQGVFHLAASLHDLRDVAGEAVASFEDVGHPVEVRAPNAGLELWGDARQVQQAIENLLSNGMKHSPEGTPIILELAHEARQGVEGVRATVADAGPGVPADLIPRLFQRFEVGETSSGLGLGLFIARRVAEVHGGTLTLDSGPGQPARFTLWFPRVAEPSN
jgi:signal transduction histidine kinase